MRGNDLLDKMELIDPAYIEAADIATRIRKHRSIKRWAAIAACFVLLLSIGMGTLIYAAEVKEYKEAVSFFEFYGLSSEDLSKGEIKTVYLDIVSNSFSHPQTAEVIRNRLESEKINGYDAFPENPTIEDIATIWTQFHIHYISIDFYFDLVRNIDAPEVDFYGAISVSDGILAYGYSSEKNCPSAWVIKADKDGNVIWKHKHDNGFDYEHIDAAFENADGSYTVMSMAKHNGSRYFCFSQYSANGENILFNKTRIYSEEQLISNAIQFNDGYIVKLKAYDKSKTGKKILRVDSEGNVSSSFALTGDGVYYYVKDMIEYNGKLYLSVDACPGEKHELAWITDLLIEKGTNSEEQTGEEILSLLRKNYTATLLICNMKGDLKTVCSAKGFFAGELSISDSGKLLWTTQRILSAYYSPYASSFTFTGKCHIYRNTFNTFGNLTDQKETGEIEYFRK